MEGYFYAERTGRYNFKFQAFNNTQLWVGGELLIDNTKAFNHYEHDGYIDFVAGNWYPIKFTESSFRRKAKLRWLLSLKTGRIFRGHWQGPRR